MPQNYFIMYFILINAAAFITYGIDKKRARKKQWRIPEKTLLLLALVGGSIGAYAGMQIFRHKTKKPLFQAGVPMILLIQGVLAVRFLILH